MDIQRAFRLPLTGGFTRIVIGALLNLVPVVNLLCCGYLLELTANVIKGRDEMPDWDDWGNKFLKGLTVLIITFIYMLIPLVIFVVGGGMVSFSSVSMTAGSILGFLATLVVWFILPMGLAHYAATGNIGSALSFATIFSLIGKVCVNYIGIYLVSLVMFFILGILTLIPFLGWIVGILGGFYGGCVLVVLFGDAYRKANLKIYGEDVTLLE